MLSIAPITGSGVGVAWPAALQAANPETALAALPQHVPRPGPLAAHVRSYIDLHQALGKHYQLHKTALQDLIVFCMPRALLLLRP